MITTGFWACARVFPGRTKGPTAATAAARVATWMKPRRLNWIVDSFSRNAWPGSWVSIACLRLSQSTVTELSASSRDGVRRSARLKHGRLGPTDARAPPRRPFAWAPRASRTCPKTARGMIPFPERAGESLDLAGLYASLRVLSSGRNDSVVPSLTSHADGVTRSGAQHGCGEGGARVP